MATRFTDHQFYYMKRLAHGVSKDEFWKWNQLQTRGLFMRGMFKFVRPTPDDNTYAMLTGKGWEAMQSCNKPLYRKDPTRPLFQRNTAHREARLQA